MKKNIYPGLLFLIITSVIFLAAVTQNTAFKNILTGRAESVDLTVKVALSGSFDTSRQPSYKTRVTLYTKNGIAKEFVDQTLKQETQNTFFLKISANDLDLNKMYAVFIKPDKFLGKIFCSENSSSANCTIPQITLHAGQNILELKKDMLLPGDVKDQDGKVDLYDTSKIIKDIGKVSTEYIETDINNDGIVNSFDFLLTLSSLSKNASDDKVNIKFETVTPPPTSQTSITPQPTPSTGTTPIPTPTSTIQPTSTPKPTNVPSPTAAPSLTPTPTPTTSSPQTQGGTCNTTLNGKAYINAGIFGNQCRKIENEKHHYCVTNQSDCNPDKCIEILRKTVKELLPSCSNGIATLDEQKTQVTCQTEFKSGSCTPEPSPACDDNRQKC